MPGVQQALLGPAIFDLKMHAKVRSFRAGFEGARGLHGYSHPEVDRI